MPSFFVILWRKTPSLGRGCLDVAGHLLTECAWQFIRCDLRGRTCIIPECRLLYAGWDGGLLPLQGLAAHYLFSPFIPSAGSNLSPVTNISPISRSLASPSSLWTSSPSKIGSSATVRRFPSARIPASFSVLPNMITWFCSS